MQQENVGSNPAISPTYSGPQILRWAAIWDGTVLHYRLSSEGQRKKGPVIQKQLRKKPTGSTMQKENVTFSTVALNSTGLSNSIRKKCKF